MTDAPNAAPAVSGDDLTLEGQGGETKPVSIPSVPAPVPELRYVRLTRKAWAGFSGSFGGVRFQNGRSLEPVTRRQADKIAANTAVVYENEDGSPAEAAGVQTRLVGGATIPAPTLTPRAVQSEEAKARETIAQTEQRVVEIALYTVSDLEKIAEDKGIAGLREIGDPLGVKGRSITDVIAAIMTEQAHRAGRAALSGGR